MTGVYQSVDEKRRRMIEISNAILDAMKYKKRLLKQRKDKDNANNKQLPFSSKKLD